jgi:hypothetical protein
VISRIEADLDHDAMISELTDEIVAGLERRLAAEIEMDRFA